MGVLKDSYTSFLEDIEKNVKNKEDLEYVKLRFADFLDVVLKQMDYIMNYRQAEFDTLEKKQKELDNRIEKMEQIIDNIEKDIYAEDGFDFEIVCPYCNYEFVVDVDENKTEVECPECNNIIELDWSGDIDEEGHNCNGSCHSCHGCEEDIQEDDDEQDDEDDDM